MKRSAHSVAIAAAVLILATALAPRILAQDNLRDGAPFNGYTGVKFDTTNYAYDYLVDSSLSQDDPANKKFKTLEAAYAAAPAGTPDKPTVIGIKPDVYLMHVDESAPYSLQITKNYITILGLTDDRRKVVLADNRGNKEGATNNGYIFDVNATGFSMINLTVVRLLQPRLRISRRPLEEPSYALDVITQAVAIQMQGDKHVYSHVAFLSRLDTTFIRTTRSYFTNVFIEGTDDFLGGGTVGVFNDSEIYFPTGSGVMSAVGLTFINTVFKASRGLEFYKGFGNPDTLIDCTMPVDTPQSPVTWMAWDVLPVNQNLFSLTYHVKDANGKPTRIRDKIKGPPTYMLSRELSDEEVKAFNPWNLLRAALPNGPVDDWDPANVRAKYQNDGSDVFRMAVTGPSPTGDIPGGGPFVSRAVSPTVRTGSTDATITATVLPSRAQHTPITWSTASSLVTLSPTPATRSPSAATIRPTAPSGSPSRRRPPTAFTSWSTSTWSRIHRSAEIHTPVRSIAAPLRRQGYACNYALDLGGREDQSLITWSQCADASCAGPARGCGQPRRPAAAHLHPDGRRRGQVPPRQHPAEAQHQRPRPGGDGRRSRSRSPRPRSHRPPSIPTSATSWRRKNPIRQRRMDRRSAPGPPSPATRWSMAMACVSATRRRRAAGGFGGAHAAARASVQVLHRSSSGARRQPARRAGL